MSRHKHRWAHPLWALQPANCALTRPGVGPHACERLRHAWPWIWIWLWECRPADSAASRCSPTTWVVVPAWVEEGGGPPHRRPCRSAGLPTAGSGDGAGELAKGGRREGVGDGGSDAGTFPCFSNVCSYQFVLIQKNIIKARVTFGRHASTARSKCSPLCGRTVVAAQRRKRTISAHHRRGTHARAHLPAATRSAPPRRR